MCLFSVRMGGVEYGTSDRGGVGGGLGFQCEKWGGGGGGGVVACRLFLLGFPP